MNRTMLAMTVTSLLPHASLLYAQERAVDDTMVILAKSDFNNSIEDIPSNVTVIDSNDIAASGAKSLDTLLRARAGIQISDTNSGPSFAMRGFSGGQASSNTLILVDGRRLNKLDISTQQISSNQVSQIERIEILSGSAGVLYGDQAVGGVINIITKESKEDEGNLSLSMGSFDSLAGAVDISKKLTDRWSLFLSANQDNTDNYREHNRRESGMLLTRINYVKDDTKFYTEASYYDNNRETPGKLTKEQYEQDPTQSISLYPTDYSHEITKALRIGYQFNPSDSWLFGTDIIYDNTTGSGIAWGGEESSSGKQLLGAVTAEKQLLNDSGQGNILIGFEGAERDLAYKISSTERALEQQMLSAYGQLNIPIVAKLTLTTGARYSRVTDNIYDVTVYPDTEKLPESQDAYELGFNYKLNESQRVYLRGESNFRFAKIDEQAYTSPGVMGLKPQTGKSIEAGWGLIKNDFSVKVDVFNLRLENEIRYDPNAPGPTGSKGANVNADKSERNGVSVSGDVYLQQDIQLGMEYSLIDAEFTAGEYEGNKLPWVARSSGRIFTTYEINYNWQFFVEGVYTGTRYKDGDKANSSDKLPAYWLANTALNFTQDVWSASLRIDNLLDEQYPSSAYVGSYAESYYPGDGRKVMLTGTYKF
ncbi:TonB-dependent receptor [Vibrio sp.]|uniref:TonB-dependent receptor family protein n=1 Tax=Vibrio sp. TaxID=678 RepID=UPI00311D9B14